MVEHGETVTPNSTSKIFSVEATDEADVVQPHLGQGPDEMWSTGAVQPSGSSAIRTSDPLVPPSGQSASGRRLPETPGAANCSESTGPMFSAEPVDRLIDDATEVESAELVDDETRATSMPFALFSPEVPGSTSGRSHPGRVDTDDDPWAGWVSPTGYSASTGFGPHRSTTETETAYASVDDQTDPDGHALDRAVSRLRSDDQEAARVPLAVCGALVEPDEQVHGVVTGIMHGCAAAVVLTNSRVLVVNERRWRPVVELFALEEAPVVIGHHDGQVATISFSDGSRSVTVNEIRDVDLAVALVEASRYWSDPDAVDSQDF